jgi:hypothetical protein
VVALQTETAPPQLRSFYPEFLEILRSINEEEGRNYPAPPIPSILNNPSYLPSLVYHAIVPQGGNGSESQCYALAPAAAQGNISNSSKEVPVSYQTALGKVDIRQMAINLHHVSTNPEL